MKINRKTVLTTAAVLGVAALAAGGTIAYFTDKTDPITNSFTVGDVKIELYESQLHRENSGRAATFSALSSDPNYCDYNTNPETYFGNASLIVGSYDNARYCTPGMARDTYSNDENDILAIKNGHTAPNRNWGFTDQVIIDDAATYNAVDGYFAEVSENIVPGQWIRKFAYVKNTDNENVDYVGSDAYVLIRYMVPTEYADDLDLKIPGTPYEEDVDVVKEGLQPYFTAVTKNATTGKYEAYALTLDSNNKPTIDAYTGYTETVNGVEYRVYAAVTTDVVEPGEMTFWSPVNTIRLKVDRQNSDPNAEKYVAPGAVRNVVVDAQAIQAKTFSNAIEAINNL